MSSKPTSALGQHLFTFVVMADTHINQSEASSASPYPSTLLTNPRARWAIHAINQIAPDFVIHLGDLTNPVPSLPAYPQAVERFRELIAPLQCPIYFVPGNHDIGDKPVEWMPAKAVNDAYLDHFEHYFGHTFYAFSHKNSRFVIANTPIINSGLPREAEQRAWLEDEFATLAGERTFFFTHYPIYLTSPDEASHYDNVDEPGRSWLLQLVEQGQVEALFTAHVHNFFYHRHSSANGHTDCYTAPAVAFVRHDYAEFFRADAAPEFARNDPAKLGFFAVDVYTKGHTVNLVRTDGAPLAADAPLPTIPPRLDAPHPRHQAAAPLGVHLRHPWAETVWIPATGGADEFARKLARNDYPLLSLWEMGVRRLRVPLQDLTDDATRARLQLLQSTGHEFTVYGYGLPSGDQLTALRQHADLIAAYELIIDWRALDQTLAALRQLTSEHTLQITLSRMRGKEDEAAASGFYFHNIRHGFRPGDPELADPRLMAAVADGTITGLAFHLPRHDAPWHALPAIVQAARHLGVRASGELRMVSDNPAEAFTDDLANANRVAEAWITAHTLEDITLFVDALMDVDRGYFARTALVDRRYAPRLAGKTVKFLAARLGQASEPLIAYAEEELAGEEVGKVEGEMEGEVEAGRLLVLRQGDQWHIVILPTPKCTLHQLPATLSLAGGQGTCQVTHLDTGATREIQWQQRASGGRLIEPLRCSVPTLLTLA